MIAPILIKKSLRFSIYIVIGIITFVVSSMASNLFSRDTATSGQLFPPVYGDVPHACVGDGDGGNTRGGDDHGASGDGPSCR